MAVPKAPLVLIADDDPDVLAVLQFRLKGWGYRIITATDKPQLLRAIGDELPSVLLLDVRFGEHNGVEILQELLRTRPGLVVVMMTAFGSIDSAVSAMKLGAHDYLTKPPDLNRLKFVVEDAVAETVPKKPANSPVAAPAPQTPTSGGTPLMGESPAMSRVRGLIAAVAPTDANVLILGESGTGKEVAARAIHAQSARSTEPFIALNMAALPRELVESTLFGHEKGAFTGADQPQQGAVEAADRGTLFLDEIGEMDIDLQAKLLRFLQERTFQRVGSSKAKSVDVRIVAATNRDPLEQVRIGRLREDLYYRLNVVPLNLPPLRERSEDVIILARYFLERLASRYRKDVTGFTSEAEALMRQYDWPGNVRQLKNVIERMVIFSQSPTIDAMSLPLEVVSPLPRDHCVEQTNAEDDDTEAKIDLRPIDRMEKEAIVEALKKSGGNVRAAAKLIGLGQATVYRKIKRYGIHDVAP